MKLVEMPLNNFIAELGSDSPAPGGGSVCALAGAYAAALCAMVCRLTVGKEQYAGVADEFNGILEKAEILQERFTLAIDEDTEAFNAVMAAFKMPKQTEKDKNNRNIAIQEAYRQAVEVPLSVMNDCFELLKLLPAVAEKGNKNAVSDAGVAARMAFAGLEGAALNVKINLPSIKDKGYAEFASKKVMDFQTGSADCLKTVLSIVESQL